jgi:hypothetical protein
MSPSKADERPKLSSIYNSLPNNSLGGARLSDDDMTKAGFCQA